jgi:hypothetical protein
MRVKINRIETLLDTVHICGENLRVMPRQEVSRFLFNR